MSGRARNHIFTGEELESVADLVWFANEARKAQADYSIGRIGQGGLAEVLDQRDRALFFARGVIRNDERRSEAWEIVERLWGLYALKVNPERYEKPEFPIYTDSQGREHGEY